MFLFAAVPCVLYFRNVKLYRPPPMAIHSTQLPRVSVLIPARNEERSIAAAVESIRESAGVVWECIVLDDHSTDSTAEIVRNLSATDERIQLRFAPSLPDGWSGKQHACFVLAKHAKYEYLSFLDADVRLEPHALSNMIAFQNASNSPLVSGFPRQETGTILEILLIPLIHFLLLGFLPLSRMRVDRRPGLGAGCGQWFLTTRESYDAVGGHSAVKSSFHDGIKLPRAYRSAGYMTDLCDVTNLATCRMYHSAKQVWLGLGKNAREGLAAPKMIVFTTLILGIGQLLPFWLLPTIMRRPPIEFELVLGSIIAAYLPRFHGVWRFRQPILGAVLHPVGIALLLMIQWYATWRAIIGRPIGWKGRELPPKQEHSTKETS